MLLSASSRYVWMFTLLVESINVSSASTIRSTSSLEISSYSSSESSTASTWASSSGSLFSSSDTVSSLTWEDVPINLRTTAATPARRLVESHSNWLEIGIRDGTEMQK